MSLMREPQLMPGMRHTQQRRLVWESLGRLGPHCTADEIALELERRGQAIPRSTVYRALDALGRAGAVRALRLATGPVHYEIADTPHQHALCDSCGTLLHLEHELVDVIESHLRELHHFEPAKVDVLVAGICADCATRRTPVQQRRRTVEHAHFD